MNPREPITRQVHGMLERDPRVNLHRFPVDIRSANGKVVLDGEVASIAAKKIAVGLAAAVPGVEAVVDQLRVAPGERRGDGAIRDSLARALLESAELRNCTFRVRANGRVEVLRAAPQDGVGEVLVSVADGVIHLEGHVESHPHRRFIGVLAWWTPGRRDVDNAIEVRPAYEDRDDEIIEVLELALEADPLVDAAQINVRCEDKALVLEGAVPTAEQKARAEYDAWALHAIRSVENRLQVTG